MMLGARTAAWAKSGGGLPTARDYVQDGLLFHWDAIENCGYGLHEEKPSAWVDLAGSGLDIPLSSRTDTWKFTDQFISEKRENGLLRQHPQTDVLDGTVSTTVEWVERIEPGYTGSRMMAPFGFGDNGSGRNNFVGGYSNWVSGGSIYMWKIGVDSRWSGKIWVKIGDNFNDGARFHYACTIDIGDDGETCTCIQYVNGVEMKREIHTGMSIIDKNDWYVSLGDTYARLSAARYYTRVLTPSEISANYAVDKARFNLQ